MRNGPDTAHVPTLSTDSARSPAPAPTLLPAIIPPLVYAFGSVFVPYLGWLAGVVLIATSRRWSRTVKLVSTLAPLVATVVYLAVTTANHSYSEGEQFDGPSASVNPLLPQVIDLFGSYVVLAASSFVAGIVLLAIALRRGDHAE